MAPRAALPLLCSVFLLTSVAQAAGEPVAAPAPPAPPVAAPVAAPPPPPAPPPVAGPPTLTLSPEKLRALREYRERSLSVQGETELSGGGYHAVGMGSPLGRGMWMDSWIVADPIVATRGWGVYQGPQRLNVPTFLGAAGQPERKAKLEADIAKRRRNGHIWMGVAGLGGAAIVTGVVGMGQSETLNGLKTWNNVTFAGTGLTITGLIGGSVPTAKASRLQRSPEASMSVAEAHKLVDHHNEALRTELQLSPEEVWLVEGGGAPMAPRWP